MYDKKVHFDEKICLWPVTTPNLKWVFQIVLEKCFDIKNQAQLNKIILKQPSHLKILAVNEMRIRIKTWPCQKIHVIKLNNVGFIYSE